MHELVLKIPKNKPPFIGVLFNYETEAVTMNNSWAQNSHVFSFTLNLEPSQKLYVSLTKDNHFSDKYEVNYDPVSLLKFLHNTKEKKEFSFGHLCMKDGSYVIARTRQSNKKLLFKIDNIKVPMLTIEI